MKGTIGLLLAGGLALCVAGCASTGAAPSTGKAAATGNQVASTGEATNIRNFNLRVKCPGVVELKKHGWSNEQIVKQLNVEESDIPTCEQYVASQPKGYVPPPPPGMTRKTMPVPAGGPSPMAAPSPAGH
jgi:hypothetical protein